MRASAKEGTTAKVAAGNQSADIGKD